MTFQKRDSLPSLPSFDARRLMEIAIEEMHKSVPEKRDDSKVPPKVGAVIWFPDAEQYEVAHRGELREGDHGEFTLLERKLGDYKLDDCILFTTLEPCMERNAPKICCARRIENARIKTVYIGIQDPHMSVDGRGKEYLEECGVKVEMFPRELQVEIEKANEEFRQQCFEEKANAEAKSGKSSLDQAPNSVDLSDFSDKALDWFRKETGISETIHSDDFKKRLLRLNLLDDESSVPTRNGIILFGKEPSDSVPEARVLGTIDLGNGEDLETFDGPQVFVPLQVLDWLRRKLPNPILRTGAVRREENEALFELVREGVVNAIVHRDYNVAGAKIQLVVSENTIVIRSPGHPVSPITIEQLQSFSAPVVSRNPTLHLVFNRMGLAEERGLGLKSMKTKAEAAGLPLPRYSWDDPNLTLTIYRSSEAAVSTLDQGVLNSLSRSQREGWKWLAKRGFTSRAEYAEAMMIGDRTALTHLSNFKEVGLVKSEGSGKLTIYRVV